MVRPGRESGVALLLTLVTLALLAIALTLIGGALAHRLKLTRYDAQTVVLGGLTDAALAEGLATLAATASSTGVPEHPFGAGSIECRIQPLGGASFRIVASGIYGARRRDVEAFVQRTPGTIEVKQWHRLSDELVDETP